jgi:hypothetical protein
MTSDELKKLLYNIEFYGDDGPSTHQINDLLARYFPTEHFGEVLMDFKRSIINGRKAQWMAGYQYGKKERAANE